MDRYLRLMALGFAICLIATLAINALVDPYGLLFTPTLNGWTAPKTEVHYHSRLVKECAVCKVAPAAVALGASDVALAIDPAHPGWAAQPVYNLAISAANIHEIRRFLEHAQARRPLRQVLMSLDISSFDEDVQDKADFDDSSLGGPGLGEGVCERDLKPWLLLASIDTFYSSIVTVGKNLLDRPGWVATPDGMWHWRRNNDAIRILGGPAGIFEDAISNTVNGDLLPPSDYSFRLADGDTTGSRFDDFRAIIDTALRERIDLRLFLGPLHAVMLETRREVGIDPDFERWMGTIVEIVATESAKYSKVPEIPIWDFGGYNSVTTEEVPPRGDMTPMRWYMDPDHYRPELGDRILDKILGTETPARPIPKDFGTQLSLENIKGVISQRRDAGDRYRTSHPQLIALIRETVKTALERRFRRGVDSITATAGEAPRAR